MRRGRDPPRASSRRLAVDSRASGRRRGRRSGRRSGLSGSAPRSHRPRRGASSSGRPSHVQCGVRHPAFQLQARRGSVRIGSVASITRVSVASLLALAKASNIQSKTPFPLHLFDRLPGVFLNPTAHALAADARGARGMPQADGYPLQDRKSPFQVPAVDLPAAPQEAEGLADSQAQSLERGKVMAPRPEPVDFVLSVRFVAADHVMRLSNRNHKNWKRTVVTLLTRTIESFPRGRTLPELLALLDVDFDSRKRAAILAELSELSDMGVVRRGRDGKWRPVAVPRTTAHGPHDQDMASSAMDANILIAAAGRFHTREQIRDDVEERTATLEHDPSALLRYYRAALRSDPRGAISQTEDRHGESWLLLTGAGPMVPEADEELFISASLDGLPDTFRQALLKREANENALAIGWPIAIGRRTRLRVIQPVGLISAEWKRTGDALELTVATDDIQLNPDWLRVAAPESGWQKDSLREVFATPDGSGLGFEEFRARLREAMAVAIHGRMTGRAMKSQLDLEVEGIHDICGLFLPTDTTFTTGAIRDLDQIAAWSDEDRRDTALGVLFDGQTHSATIPAINPGPLNAEQIEAVRHANRAPLTVVTGPPGTGKSQTIVAMAASILNSGGSVLVASRNHQALNAVEERLQDISPEARFLVRTLDPTREIDTNFNEVLAALVNEPPQPGAVVDNVLIEELDECASLREAVLDRLSRGNEIRTELADLAERIDARRRAGMSETAGATESSAESGRGGFLARVVRLARRLLGLQVGEDPDSLEKASRRPDASVRTLTAREAQLRYELDNINISEDEDPVVLTGKIAKLVRKTLPRSLASRVALSDQDRQSLGREKADLDFAGKGKSLDPPLAKRIVTHRPLWLASALGTPKRIPLVPGLFDLVIFDEASQCDIASALPLFARARRAVVVGDSNQLSFIRQIGESQDRNLMRSQGLDPAGMGRFAQSRQSLFDFADLIPDVRRVMLRDQYRSALPITDYISREFYGGRLRPAVDPSKMKTPTGQRLGLHWTNVAAPSLPQTENVNRPEVEAIVTHLKKLLDTEAYDGEVGVITPFRPQAFEIGNRVRASLSADILKRSRFRAGTVDSFQGQERDVILFSPCIGPTAAASAVQFVQRDWRRLNVAISRARSVAHVFGDLDYARSGKIRSLQRLADAATGQTRRKAEGVFDSDWERRVFHALKKRGLDPEPQYEIAGRRLDFALFGKGGIRLDLEVDGRYWHMDIDGKRKMSDLWRDHQLKSLGWRVRRFWVDELANDMEGCLDLVERDLS